MSLESLWLTTRSEWARQRQRAVLDLIVVGIRSHSESGEGIVHAPDLLVFPHNEFIISSATLRRFSTGNSSPSGVCRSLSRTAEIACLDPSLATRRSTISGGVSS